MRRILLGSGSFTAAALVALTIACDDFPSKNPAAPSVSPGPLEIQGPASIEPNGTAQLLAGFRLPDGTFKVAGNVRWSSNTFYVRIDTQGVATAQGRTGETVIQAEVIGMPGGTRRATREIVFQPAGTFRLSGFVFDSEYPTVPITGVRVASSNGVVGFTDFQGAYRLYGVAPTADLEISKSGYLTQTTPLQLSANTARTFLLAPNGPRLTLSGNYTVAIDVLGSCSSISSTFQHRVYNATVTQSGLTATVTLTDGIFRLNSIGKGNKFTGTVTSEGVNFVIEPWASYYYFYYGPTGYPSLAERLGDSSILIYDGIVSTTGTPASLTGTWFANVWRYDSRFPTFGFLLGSCFNTNTRLTLTHQ